MSCGSEYRRGTLWVKPPMFQKTHAQIDDTPKYIVCYFRLTCTQSLGVNYRALLR